MTTAFRIEITLQNGVKKLIKFNHNELSVSELELSRHIYQHFELKDENIDPCIHHLRYLDRLRERNYDEIQLFPNKPTRVECFPRNLKYTSKTIPTNNKFPCAMYFDKISTPPKLSENEVAFIIGKFTRWGMVILLISMFCCSAWVPSLPLVIQWAENYVSFKVYSTILAVSTIISCLLMLYLLFHSVVGKVWLIIDAENDKMYLQFEYWRNQIFSKRYELNMKRFRGIRFAKPGTLNIENAESPDRRVVLVFDGDENNGNGCNYWLCGPVSGKYRVFGYYDYPTDTPLSAIPIPNYYVIAKYFAERSGDREDFNMKFSINKRTKDILRAFGVEDGYGLLRGVRAWREYEYSQELRAWMKWSGYKLSEDTYQILRSKGINTMNDLVQFSNELEDDKISSLDRTKLKCILDEEYARDVHVDDEVEGRNTDDCRNTLNVMGASAIV